MEGSRARVLHRALQHLDPEDTGNPKSIKKIWPGSALIIVVRSAGTREGRSINETRCRIISLRSTAKALL